jgi:predicted Ser/Thr protein kinase
VSALSALPDSIGGYRVEGVLGRGASGLVFRVKDETLDRSLALKLLTDDVDAEARGRFLIEARAAARIAHPNVVQVYAVGEHEGRAFITQELVDGYPLSSLLEVKGQLGARAVVDIGLQVAEGLRRAAEVGVLHRDVKPQNLLVTDDGTVKLADFGVAKLLDAPSALTDDGTTVGTPHYMSPEQGQGRSLDARSDQYALGATLYHLLVGEPPFDADNVLSLLLKHVQEPLPPIRGRAPECPEAVALVVERMLAKEPGQRFADFTEVIGALEATVTAEDPAAPEPEVLALVEAATKEGKPRLPTEALPAVQAAPPAARSMADRLIGVGVLIAAAAVLAVTQLDRASEKRITRSEVPVVVEPPPAPPPAPTLVVVQAAEAEPAKKPVRLEAQSVHELSRSLDKEASVAERAALELGRRGDQSATPSLIRAVERGSPKVAAAAAWALGELGDIRAVEPLQRAKARGAPKAVEQAATQALQKLWHVEGE